MKNFKAIVTVVIMIIMIPFIQSCLPIDKDDEMSNIPNGMPYNAALATVISPGEVPGEAIIESDNEGTAFVVNPEKLIYYEANNKGQRIFYTYRKAESPKGDDSKSSYISIDFLRKILTKPMDVLQEGEEDVYGHDKINLISYNMGNTHLTLLFQILGFDTSIKHRISLVAKADAIPDTDGYISVELRHNAEGDKQEYISSDNYVSFPLSSVPGFKEGTLKGFKIKINTISYGEDIVTISKENSKSKSFQILWEETSNTKTK